MARKESGTVRPTKRKRVFFAAAVLLIVCVLAAGAVSAANTVTVYDYAQLSGNISSDQDDLTIIIADNVSISGTLAINNGKNITLRADGTDRTLSRDGFTGNLFCVNSGGKLTITGYGTSNLTLDGTGQASDSLVYVNGGSFTLADGGILTNNMAKDNGGGVYVKSGTFTMTGGSITNNTAEFGFGGALCVDGDNNEVTITLSGGEISNNTATNGGGVFMKGSQTAITLSGTAKISNNKALTENEGTLSTGHGGGVHIDDGRFSITDSATITGNKAGKNGGGVYVHSGGTFRMSGGEISKNTASSYGGGVHVGAAATQKSQGTFTMSSGTITDNTAESGGAVMLEEAGKFTMEGGTISNNTATNGGGVFMKGESSMFDMSGGTIFNNTAYKKSSETGLGTGHGGGVHIDEGTFEMSSGTISGNTATENGGGVYVHFDGTFTMSGGTITGNRATANGGGVCANTTGTTTGTFEMSGGKISGNEALYGNGVYVGSIFNLKGDGTVDGVYLPNNKNITVIGSLTGTEQQVTGIIPADPQKDLLVVDLAIASKNYLSRFQLDDSVENFALKHQPHPERLVLTPIYTVTFNAKGGTPEPKAVKVVSGNTVEAPETTQEGYTLEGWYNGTTKWDFTQDVVNGNITLTANWTLNTYTVTFEANGGSEVQPQTVNHGETVNKPKDPVKDDHTFAGWHENTDCTQPWNFDTGTVTGSMTLYAKWTEKPSPEPPSGGGSSDGNMDNAYRVLFNDGAATLYVVTDLSAGDKLTKPEDPVKDGYTFAGWHKDTACTQAWDFNDGITGSMTLYAKWTPQETVTPTATATPTVTATATATQTAEPTGNASPAPTSQPDNNGNSGDTTNGETTATSGISLPYLIGGILILLLAILLLLILLLRHTVTFLIPTGGEITEHRIKVWHGRYINTEDLPDLIRTAAWYRDPARQERWDFDQDRVKKSIELYLG